VPVSPKSVTSHRVIPIRIARENLAKWNKRIGKKLDDEQHSLAKKLRKPRNSDPFEALEALYEYMDRVYRHADGLVACKKGCSHCCYIPVHATFLEIEHISARTGVPISRPLVYSNLSLSPTHANPANPCPFLLNNECSIYDNRPLTCRTHVNFEPTSELCKAEASGQEQVLLVDRAKSFPAIMKTFFSLGGSAASYLCEVRDYFRAVPTKSAVTP
jgi:Fe-S-cluster containining protein